MNRIIPLTLAALLWTTYGEEQVFSDKLPILSFIASQEDGTPMTNNGHRIEATELMGSSDVPEPPEQPTFMKLREFPGIGPEGVPFSISFATANENEVHPVAFNEPPPPSPTSAILLKAFPHLPKQLLSPSLPASSFSGPSGPPLGFSSPQSVQEGLDQKPKGLVS